MLSAALLWLHLCEGLWTAGGLVWCAAVVWQSFLMYLLQLPVCCNTLQTTSRFLLVCRIFRERQIHILCLLPFLKQFSVYKTWQNMTFVCSECNASFADWKPLSIWFSQAWSAIKQLEPCTHVCKCLSPHQNMQVCRPDTAYYKAVSMHLGFCVVF